LKLAKIKVGFRKSLLWFLTFLIVVGSSFHMYIIFTTAAKPLSEIFRVPITWWPQKFSWENFYKVFSYFPLATLFRNSLIIGMGTIIGTLILGIPAAYALSRHLHIRGQNMFLMLILASQLFSPIIIIFPLYKMMSSLRLLNTIWSVMLGEILYSLAFVILLLTGFLNTVPKEVVECAELDGATKLGVLWRILVPLIAPGLVVTAVYVFIVSWNDFIFAFMFNDQMESYTVIVGIYALLSQTVRSITRWDYIMVASLYSCIPIQVFFALISRHLVRGLTAGAVKA